MFRRPSSIILHLCGCSLGVDLIIVAHDLDAGDGEEARGAGAGVGSRADERGSRTPARIPRALSAPRPLSCPPLVLTYHAAILLNPKVVILV